jgi:hypothetical protein
MRAYGSRHPGAAPVWHAQADSAAGRLVSTEAPDARASRRYEARASRAPAGGVGSTHPSASSRAERLRLCESQKSADRSQSRTSSSGWTSATARSSSSRSASPVLRDSSNGAVGVSSSPASTGSSFRGRAAAAAASPRRLCHACCSSPRSSCRTAGSAAKQASRPSAGDGCSWATAQVPWPRRRAADDYCFSAGACRQTVCC